MADGRDNDPLGRSHESRRDKRRALANEHRLLALGEAVDNQSGVTRKSRKHRPHRTRRNLIISAIVLVGLIAGVVGGSRKTAIPTSRTAPGRSRFPPTISFT